MKYPILFCVLLCGLNLSAQTVITTYTPGVSAEGAAYYLPKTAINVSITTEKTTYTPGELCHYADRYLRITGISNKENTYHTIQSVRISSEGVPDETKLYHILFAPNTVAPLVSLTESGVLQAVNVSSFTDAPKSEFALPVSSPGKELSVRSYMTEEMLMAGSKAKLAELVAKEIYSIRESKNAIVRGQNEYMPKDSESLRIILSNLEEQELAFTQLFTGTTSTEVTTQTYQIIPEGTVEKVVFGRFSRKFGLLHGDDLAGAPLYIEVKCKQVIPEPSAEALAMIGTSKPKKTKNANLQDGLVYNLPGKADIKVYANSQLLAEESFAMAQFGRTETLSSTLLVKKKDIKIVLSPVTGALLSVQE